MEPIVTVETTRDNISIGRTIHVQGDRIHVHPDVVAHLLECGAVRLISPGPLEYRGRFEEAQEAFARRQERTRREAALEAERRAEPAPRVLLQVAPGCTVFAGRRTYNPGERAEVHCPRAVEYVAAGRARLVGEPDPAMANALLKALKQRQAEAEGHRRMAEWQLGLDGATARLAGHDVFATDPAPEPEPAPTPAPRAVRKVAASASS